MELREAQLSRREIEEKLKTVGDYVKMDYLNACLKKPLDFDTRKFVMIKLAGVYEVRGMFADAGKLFRAMAEINTTFQGKINDFVKSGDLFVKEGKFNEGDLSFGKAMSISTVNQKAEVRAAMKESYRTQAKIYLAKSQRKHALDTYERLLSLEFIMPEEKKEVQKIILELYDKLGKVREAMNLRRSLGMPL